VRMTPAGIVVSDHIHQHPACGMPSDFTQP
jgi:hypothetical protein